MYRPDRYARNWKALALACKAHARWHCEVCGVAHGTKRTSHRTGVVYTVFLHAAHTTLHDTGNPNPTLLALCPTCHGQFDWHLRKIEAAALFEQRKHQLLLTCRK